MGKFTKSLKVGLLAAIATLSLMSSEARATVSDLDTRTTCAAGNGVTTNYTIGFDFRDNDDVDVYLQDTSTTPYTNTLLVYGSGAGKFTITGGDPGTTVVMGTAPSATQRCLILRSSTLTQPVAYDETRAFPAADHEEQMDKMILLLQEQQASLDSAAKLPSTSSPVDVDMTLPSPVASRLIGWNSSGTGFSNYASTGTLSVSAFIETLLDDTTAAIARATLGFSGALGTVATANIENLAVTAAKIAAGTITNTEVSATAAIARTKLGNPAITAKTSTYLATSADDTITVDGTSAFTVTLPAAASNSGKVFFIKRIDQTLANVVTIDGNASETIDGALTRTLATQYESVTIQSDGSNWHVIGRFIPSGWATYTPTMTGFGTATNIAGEWRRVGDSIQLKGVETTGTSTAVEARASIPTGLTSASSAKIPTLRIAGQAAWDQSTVTRYELALIEPSVTYITFSQQDSTGTASAGYAKINGNVLSGSGQKISWTAEFPISGWEN